MITMALVTVLSLEAQSPVTSLAQWEACAISAASTCSAPSGTTKWKSCLEAASAQMNTDEWDMCEFTSFPDCFPKHQPKDVQTELRICGAQRVVAARTIALAWTDEAKMRGGRELGARMETVMILTEQLASDNLPTDPVAASGSRVGSWTSGLKALALVRRSSTSQ